MDNISGWEYIIDGDIAIIDIGKIIIDRDKLEEILAKRWKIILSTDINCKKVLIYNLLLNRESKKGVVIDHIDNNPLNNTKKNLREISYQHNGFNRKSYRGKSKYKGVCWIKSSQKWRSSININNKEIYLGQFDNEIEAAKEYDKKLRELFGDNNEVCFNFPNGKQEKYEQKLTYEENEDGSFSIDFGKLIVDVEDLQKILVNRWTLYVSASYKNGHKQIHNVIFGEKQDKNNVIDHINGSRLDNRIENLREITKKQNSYNSRPQVRSSSKYKGVSKNKKKDKWEAKIKSNNRYYNIGLFKDEKIAAKNYDAFAKYLFGEHAYLNFPEEEIIDLNVEEIITKRNNKKTTSKYHNVCHLKNGLWRSRKRINGVDKTFGSFKTEEEAYQKMIEWEKSLEIRKDIQDRISKALMTKRNKEL